MCNSVPDTSSAMRIYRAEIIKVALITINTSSVFAMRAQAAKALIAVVESGVLNDDVNCAGLFVTLVLKESSQ